MLFRSPAVRKRVMVVDDHDLVRRGVAALVRTQEAFEVCSEAATAAAALELAEGSRPDILIVDLSLPDGPGIDVIAQLKAELPALEVLVLTLHESEQLFGQAVRAGARAYVLKSDPGEHLINALHAVSRREPYFSPQLSECLLELFLQSSTTEVGDLLTPREREVVRLVARGRSNKEIGRLLGMKEKTVEAHRSAVMQKIGARSAADLTMYAARNGLVEL